MSNRVVTLRDQRSEAGSRHLSAYLDEAGNLHIDGQDLGAGTEMVSDDGEYEWFQTIAAQDVPSVVALLGGKPGDAVLDILEGYKGHRCHELERLLRESDVPVNRVIF